MTISTTEICSGRHWLSKISAIVIQDLRNLYSRVTLRARRFGLPTSQNDWKLWRLKDRHRGRRAFILGNGPSLKLEFLERLTPEVTFAMNQAYKCFGKSSWRPTYYMLMDPLVAQSYGEAIFANYSGIVLVGQYLIPTVRGCARCIGVRVTPDTYGDDEPGFSRNPMFKLISGNTTTYLCMQLAWYMGIREFITLGIDASYSFEGAVTKERRGNLELIDRAPKENWFMPNYCEAGAMFIKPQVKRQLLAHQAARRFIEGNGGSIVNAGEDSPLPTFKRVRFADLF